MAGSISVAIIKPKAVESGHTGAILHTINAAGFCIRGLKMMQMTRELAEEFYAVHKKREFFNDLVTFMTSGPIVVISITAENAVANFRNTIGATDPKMAASDTIRAKFGVSMQMNAIHGSDSDENALRETELLFSPEELFDWKRS
ncbi:MAG: nucleoside-diphosphate kinase [Bacteroidetes bacterium HGW-Bacteroidetes-6]|jgi:nucleoside-diphosphate kinase|nr:MAG: nucleoside-diphosphate kinase [Bacteroidetes bacterium HGW-Bacteroidetes-6]